MCCGNGCQPMHLNGIGQSYVEQCSPPGTPGNESTYSLAMATAARAAAPAGTDGNLSCGNGVDGDQLPDPHHRRKLRHLVLRQDDRRAGPPSRYM